MNFITQTTITRSWRLVYLVFAVLCAILFDVFFWHTRLGLGFVLFVFLYVAGFITLAILSKQFFQPRALFLLIPIFVFSLDVVLYNNILVESWAVLFVAVFLLAFSGLLTLKNPVKHLFSFTKLPIFKDITLPFAKLKAIYQDLFFSKPDRNNELYKKIAIGLIISIPILIVFGLLFAKADAVFASWWQSIFHLNIDETILARIFRSVIIAIFLGSLFYVVTDAEYILGEKKISALKIDNTIVAVVLSLVNLLFLVFVFIQVTYLFGSRDFVVNNGINFAEYARSGFFQLVWVIALAAIMLIVFYRSTVFHGSNLFLKSLKVLLILQVGVIAISALKRMNIYQAEFGFTVLRLYVEWFIYFCLVILGIAAVSVSIDWQFRKFFYTSLILGVSALCLVSSVNVDRMIAKGNVDRYLNEHKELDMGYLLFNLSIDAVPEVKRAFEAGFIYTGINNDLSYYTGNFAEIYLGKKFQHLHTRISGGRYSSFSQIHESWKEFNFGVQALKKL